MPKLLFSHLLKELESTNVRAQVMRWSVTSRPVVSVMNGRLVKSYGFLKRISLRVL